jgi:thiamine pyrophosphokinase
VNETITIITGAVPIPPEVAERIPPGDVVVAADGGLDHARNAGLEPSVVVGDMDSISDDGLEWAHAHATVVTHPADKDQTDTELALALALGRNPARITLIGGGDRLDHSLASLGALGHPTLTSVPELDAWWGGQHVRVVHGPGRARIACPVGSTVSLLALHGRCTGVVVRNVRWELDGVDLDPAIGLGISNVAGRGGDGGDGLPTVVEVALSTGVLTVFDQPLPYRAVRS